jgi:hypothetical protein
MRVYAILLMATFITVGCTSCSDDQLGKVAKSLNVLATAVGELQTNVQLAEQQQLLDQEIAKQILQICKQVNVAGQQVGDIVKSIQALDPASRSDIVKLLKPIGDSLDVEKLTFIANIKDPATQQKVKGSILLIRSTISSITVIVAASGG